MTGSGTCELMIAGVATGKYGVGPVCVWRDDFVLDVVLGYVPTPNNIAAPGDALQLLGDAILLANENSYGASSSAVLMSAGDAEKPLAVLDVPAVVGHCDPVTLDAGNSLHGGGRDMTFVWDVDVSATLDESGAQVYSCVDDGFALDSSNCLDQNELMSQIASATCSEALAGNLDIEGTLVNDCASWFCPTCTFRNMCDSSCGYCSYLDGVEEDCATTITLLTEIPIISQVYFGCAAGVVCDALTQALPYMYTIYAVAPGVFLPERCQLTTGDCEPVEYTLITAANTVRPLLSGVRPTVGAADLMPDFTYTFSVEARSFLFDTFDNLTASASTFAYPGDLVMSIDQSTTEAKVAKRATVLPLVHVLGPSTQQIRRPDAVRLYAHLQHSSCWTGNETMEYEWSIAPISTDACVGLTTGSAPEAPELVLCNGNCVPRSECRVPDLSQHSVTRGTRTTKDLYISPLTLSAGESYRLAVRATVASRRADVIEECTTIPGTGSQEFASATVCVLTPVSPTVAGSCARTRGYGSCVYVAPSKAIWAEASVQVDVQHSDVVAVIKKGSRTVALESDLVLDGTGSFDPDDPNLDSSTAFVYDWSCVTSSRVVADAGWEFADSCSAEYPHVYSVGEARDACCATQVDCVGDALTLSSRCCFDNAYSYCVNPPCSDYVAPAACSTDAAFVSALTSNSPSITLDPGLFALKHSLKFTLTVTRVDPTVNANKLSTTAAVITIAKQYAPDVEIRSVGPFAGEVEVDPSREFVLEGTVDLGLLPDACSSLVVTGYPQFVECSDGCVARTDCPAPDGVPYAQGQLEWVQLEGGFIGVEDIADVVGVVADRSRLTVPAGALSMGQIYTMRLFARSNYNATDPTDFHLESFVDYSFSVSMTPSSGSVEVEVLPGNDLANSSVNLLSHPDMSRKYTTNLPLLFLLSA